ncbi:MAG: choice-of-anchor C family protein [Phycisphaeraceae bacterium]|nr:choice-of-anchor C family protein [Phycisphaeraceae bacterium]
MNARPALIRLAATTATFCASTTLAQNMLTNPSFESGPTVAGTFLALNAGSTAMPGWIVTRGQIDIVTTGWQQIDGLRSLDLNGSPGSGGVAQTFPTTINRDYTISFYVAGNAGAAPAIKTMWVTVAGQTAGVQFDNTGTSNANMKWTKYIYGFRAVSSNSTLEFYSGNPSSFGGPALDDVVVRPGNCLADLNYDGYVDDADFVAFVTAYEQVFCSSGFPGCAGDFNFDAVIDDADFVIFVVAYNQLLCS